MRPYQDQPDETVDQDSLRAQAVRRLHRKRGFQAHALSFVLVNLVSVSLWWFLTPRIFFWPLYLLLSWGIGLAFHAWAVYLPSTPDEERVQREIDRIRRR
ncbi:2TM domain-containing protein [Promicromonospora thailandica]|uniref:2TM domain-containing protein n=1 Tax=Promicromonospora thailandica TaxID=765201 RepID=A0A9X2GBG4_9MICO|nr:2TM domain-containing protein [Promicromonospora thailandica]MCP2266066.1 2TM domain-containing protein [Promicromonospora thailandica]BFF21332.1 hypothetical protein GCM10025730_48530 [Promicromonospora thailandica]